MQGKVLWWDERDGYGIITRDDGVEFYTDVSVTGGKHLKARMKVTFNHNPKITDCRCAMDVQTITGD